jgi:hypothetical protein
MERLAIILVLALIACGAVLADEARPILLPMPKRVTWLNGHLLISGSRQARACVIDSGADSKAIDAGIRQLNEVLVELGARPLPVIGTPEDEKAGLLLWVGTEAKLPVLSRLVPQATTLPQEVRVPDGYVLRCLRAGERDVIACIGHDDRGCYYGLQTLVQLLQAGESGVSVPRVGIVDWPTYRIRLVKVSGSRGDPETVARIARLLPRYKANVFALQYHSERDGTWREPSERYRSNIERVGGIAQEDGVLEPGLFLCPFLEPRIDVTKPEDIRAYVDRLRWGIEHGCKWIEVDFNDWAKWEYLSEAEKARFADTGEFSAYLVNETYHNVREKYPDVGVIVCPMIGWYRGPAKPELVTLCRAIPDDVLVYWTGPVTRSRRISEREVADWTTKTGRKPFLWDNTIYAHFQPYWVGYAFNPYYNRFPGNLPELLAGPGIHLNSSAEPHYLPGFLTFADYMWNPEAYDPQRSIRNALQLCWGKEAPDAAQAVQDRLIALHRMLYEAGKGWEAYDRERADRMLTDLGGAIRRLAEVAGDPSLGEFLDSTMLGEARRAIEGFEPPEKLSPRPQAASRPLADGVVNGSAEEIADGKPVGWSLYGGAGSATLTVSPEAHSGERSLCLEATRWYHDPSHPVHGDRNWINVAIMHGTEAGGMAGWDAYDVEPDRQCRCSFWLRGDVPRVKVVFQGWSTGMGAGARHELEADLTEIEPTEDWREYTATFCTDFDTVKFALKIGILGYEDEGMRLGGIWVDDVVIESIE